MADMDRTTFTESKETLLDRIGSMVARRLTATSTRYEPYAASRSDFVERVIQPGDVLLVEGGRSKISSAIKYLTQSTWSHAALYVGTSAGLRSPEGEICSLVEAELGIGIVAVPLSKYRSFNLRICRPVGLAPDDLERVLSFAISRIGGRYDLKNVIDLMRYLLPNPPVPQRFRRRMLALGSGEPTRAICSTLIARAFQEVRYPILPRVEQVSDVDGVGGERMREIFHIRESSLYTPRDFDVSPFFRVIKPTVELGFDYKQIAWADRPLATPPSPPT